MLWLSSFSTKLSSHSAGLVLAGSTGLKFHPSSIDMLPAVLVLRENGSRPGLWCSEVAQVSTLSAPKFSFGHCFAASSLQLTFTFSALRVSLTVPRALKQNTDFDYSNWQDVGRDRHPVRTITRSPRASCERIRRAPNNGRRHYISPRRPTGFAHGSRQTGFNGVGWWV